MKMIFGLLLGLIAISGCSKKNACDVQQRVQSTVATGVATGLSCQNKDAIDKWLGDKLTPLKLCDKSGVNAKTAAGPVCTTIAAVVVGASMTQIPADWKCSPTAAVSVLKHLIEQGCTASIGL